MKQKKKTLDGLGGIMYSTDRSYIFESEDVPELTLPNTQQNLKVMLDKKNRGGKAVTLVEGFSGTPEDLEVLTKMLKTRCGVGGSCKHGEILIQGDFREKVIIILKNEGYKVKRVGG